MKKYTAAHWGVYEAETSPENKTRLKPLATDPDPSPIGLTMLDASRDESIRLMRPAVRAGWLESRGKPDRKGRGHDDPFIEVSWDEALSLVSEELKRVIDQHGSSSIFGGSYGWSSAGRFHHAQSQIHRFLNATGGYVSHRDSYSLGAGRALLPYIVAPMDELIASHSSWDTLIEHTELFVSFGGVPAKNAQVSPGGPGDHLVATSLNAMHKRGVEFVNISPQKGDLDPGGRFQWIPIKPTTDTALMLGIAYVIHKSGRHDRDFLARCTVGFEKFEAYLTGDSDGIPKTPQWAADITGVNAQEIIALAEKMTSKRTMINVVWALQRADFGEQPFWMTVTLAAMLGQIGLPGGGFGIGYGSANTMGNRTGLFPGPTFSQGRNPVADFIPVARVADMLLNPGGAYQYKGSEYTYSDIRLVYWAGGNPFHHHQDLNRLRKAWDKPETIIVNEQYWTATAKMADIVLPATTSFERDDMAYAKRERYMTYMSKLYEPIGEAKDDYEIFALLAKRMGLEEVFTGGMDSEAWLRSIYKESRDRSAAVGVQLPDYDTFRRQGLVDLYTLQEPAPVTMFEDFRRDPQRHKLNTKSGKLEIFCEEIASYQLDDCGGHPQWYVPREWLDEKAEKEGRFHLISDQPHTKLHGQLDHSEYSRANKIKDREPIHIHVDDMKALGLCEHDVVRVFNDRGACLAAAVATESIRRGVVKLATGAWFDAMRDEAGKWLDIHGNPNVLTRDVGSSSLSQGCSAHSCLVSIERYNGHLPPVTAFNAPTFLRNVPGV